MSGGAFNYLHHAEADDLFQKRGDLRDMAAALTNAGAHSAARETEAVLSYVEHAERQIDARVYRLRDLWRAMDYWQSCDTTEADFRAALEDYNNE